jgi:hypothetical protein
VCDVLVDDYFCVVYRIAVCVVGVAAVPAASAEERGGEADAQEV